MTSELARINFRNMISDNRYELGLIQRGRSAASIFKTPRIKRFVLAGILVPERGHKIYRLTLEATDALAAVRRKTHPGRQRGGCV